MVALFILLVVRGAGLVTTASGQSTCLPEFAALDVIELLKTNAPRTFTHRLKSKNVDGIFLSKASLTGRFNGVDQLDLEFRFDTNGVGLPYNIYAVLVASPEEAFAWHDLTKGCTGAGASIFPGGSFKLPVTKLSRSLEINLHLLVWGRL
jgi:hypothetical protein